MQTYWGIDFGGTKMEAVVLDKLSPDSVISRRRFPTEAYRGYRHILDQVARLVDHMAQESGMTPDKIGMGTPGALDPPTQCMKNSNTTALNGKPFKRDLEEKLGIPVVLANDANCFALAEAKMGVIPEKVPDAKIVVGLIIGTGVGSGIVINGKVLNGKQGIAGEWGHNYLDESGGKCYCGKSGCVETLISGPALENHYFKLSGKKAYLSHIFEKLQKDPHADATHARMIHFFGKSLSGLINILDPDAVVIGGGVGNIDSLYTEGVASVQKHIFNLRLDTPILKPKLGDSAGVFGAAALTQ